MPNQYLEGERLKVFVLFSGGASSGIGLADGDNHMRTYELVGAGTNNIKASGVSKFAERDIPVLTHDYLAFCRQYGLDPARRSTNRSYHEEWLKTMEQFRPHTIALSGYFRIVPDFFLQEYPDTKNVHPMALHFLARKLPRGQKRVSYDELMDAGDWDPLEVAKLCRHEGWERAFKGDSAVFDALVFGYDPTSGTRITELRSTIHRATEEYDEGPIEVESAPIPIDTSRVDRMIRTRNWDGVMGYAGELQNVLKARDDIPAFVKAVELAAERRLVHRDGAVFIDGETMPYKGLQLTE